MMKMLRLAAALAAFCVACEPALAQWQVPLDAIPIGRGAGTGFASLSCPTLGSFPIYNGSAWVCSTATAPQAAVLNGTLNLNPLANSVQRGLNITTSGPDSGSTAGAIYSNLIQGSWDNTLTGAGGPGDPTGPNWSLVQISASTGGNFSGLESYALSVGNVLAANKASTAEMIGVSMGVQTSYTNAGRMYGGSSAATVSAGGSTPVLVGFEIGVAQNNSTTSNVPIRYGLNVDNYGSYTASGVDTAISIQGGATGGSWKTGITFTNPGGALAAALTTTGNMMASEVAMTVDTIFDFSNVTATSYVFNTPNSQLTGAGVLGLGSNGTDGGVSLVGGAGGNMSVTWTHNATANFTLGATSTLWYLTAVGAGSNALQVAKSTNIVTIPTGLAVQGSFTSSVNLTPASDDGASLGTTALKWSDQFLASGAVINFNNGNYTLTHSAGNLTAAGGPFTAPSFIPNSSTVPSNGNYLPAANTLGWAINSAAEMQLTSTALSPAVSGGNALGTTSLMWANLFLAAGGAVNWNNGAATMTESSGNLNHVVASGKTFNFQGGDGSTPVVQVLSGNGSVPSSMNFGRVSSEALLGVAASAGNFWTGAAGGDLVLRALGGKLILTTGYTNGGVVVDTSDNLAVGATTASTSSTTGALKSAGGIAAAGAIWAGTYVNITPTVVNSLPSCAAGTAGARAYVTDNATAVAFNGAVTTGGSNKTPVFCDGSTWKQGANDNLPDYLLRKHA